MAIDTDLPPQGTQEHVYTQPGTYTVVFTDEADGTKTKQVVITVPFGPVMTVTEDPNDSDRRTVMVTVNNHNSGSVFIDWGDGSRHTSNVGDGQEVSRHKYLSAGAYTIKASDADEPSRVIETEVTVPFTQAKPVITVTEDASNTDRMGVLVAVDNHGEGPVRLEFGEGEPVENPGDGTTSAHTYSTAGTYTIKATDLDNAALTSSEQVTVPFSGALWGIEVAEAATSPERMAVTVTVTDPAEGASYEVNWGEGEEDTWEELAEGSGSHTYAAAGTYTVSVRDAGTPSDVRTAEVTVPFGVQFLATEAATPGENRRLAAVTVTQPVEGTTYEVQWETDGGFTALSGTPPTLTQAAEYAADGTKNVTVRAQGDETSATTVEVSVPFPGPVFTVEQNGEEARGVTVSAPAPETGTLEANFGDSEDWLPLAGEGPVTAAYTYGGEGAATYEVKVRNSETPDVVAVHHVSVPFPQAAAIRSASGRRRK